MKSPPSARAEESRRAGSLLPRLTRVVDPPSSSDTQGYECQSHAGEDVARSVIEQYASSAHV